MPAPGMPPVLVYLAALAAVLVPIFALFEGARKFATGAWAWLWKKLAPKESIYRVELRITPGFHLSNYWTEGGMGTDLCMIVICELNVSNIGSVDIFQIVDAYILKPRTHTMHSLDIEPYSGRVAHTISLTFGVLPPVRKSGESFKADIVLVDQFATKHTIKGVVFKAMGGRGWDAVNQMAQKKPLQNP